MVLSSFLYGASPFLYELSSLSPPLLSSPISSMWISPKRTTNRDEQSGPLAHLQRWLHKSGWACVCMCLSWHAMYFCLFLWSPLHDCLLYVMSLTKGLSLCAVVWRSFPNQWSIRILSYALGCYFIQFPLLLSYQQYVDLTKEDNTVQAGELDEPAHQEEWPYCTPAEAIAQEWVGGCACACAFLGMLCTSPFSPPPRLWPLVRGVPICCDFCLTGVH